MKKPSTKSAVVEVSKAGDDEIAAYSEAQLLPLRAICDVLRELIDTALPKATSKVWHGSPVWFIDDNPVVGYSTTAKKTVNLLFWNGKSFDEPALKSVGKYQAAQAVFADADEVDSKVIRGWLKTAKGNVFDSKAYFAKLRQEKSAKVSR